MYNTRIFTLLSALLLYSAGACAAETSAVQASPDDQQIRGLVMSWQEAHQQRNNELLASLYGAEVDYYGQHLAREQVIAAKRAFFSKEENKEFSQSIASPLHIEGIEGSAESGEAPVTNGKQVEFVKRAGSSADTVRNYPSTLRVSKDESGKWKIVAESDDITDLNLKQPTYSRVVRGKFDGKTEQYAWVRGQDPISGNSCTPDGDCICKLWNSDPAVQPVSIPSCIDASLAVLPGLDGTGRDRLQVIQDWWTSGWTLARLYDVQQTQWIQIVPAFSTNANQLEESGNRILVVSNPARPGYIRIKVTRFDPQTEELRTEQQDKPLLALR